MATSGDNVNFNRGTRMGGLVGDVIDDLSDAINKMTYLNAAIAHVKGTAQPDDYAALAVLLGITGSDSVTVNAQAQALADTLGSALGAVNVTFVQSLTQRFIPN